MGGILNFFHIIHLHWEGLTISVFFSVATWGAGYLRGYRHGEESEQRHKHKFSASLARTNEKLRETIDFLQADNDSLRRRNSRAMPGGPVVGLKSLGPSTPNNQKEVG